MLLSGERKGMHTFLCVIGLVMIHVSVPVVVILLCTHAVPLPRQRHLSRARHVLMQPPLMPKCHNGSGIVCTSVTFMMGKHLMRQLTKGIAADLTMQPQPTPREFKAAGVSHCDRSWRHRKPLALTVTAGSCGPANACINCHFGSQSDPMGAEHSLM